MSLIVRDAPIGSASPVAQPPSRRSIYAELGVRTIINARGATTAVGGTLIDAEVLAAMTDASRHFVVLDELNRRVGETIAAATGAEAGYVTSGSAAGMALAAAACVAGADPERIRTLPDAGGYANEIVVHRAHRLAYDQMYRLGGGRLVEIGLPLETERWELERAITGRTAAVAYHDSPTTTPGALPFEVVVEVAHERCVPVIVDAASTLPPVDHLRRWIRAGADLVVYSGGKGIRGPQDSGMLAGRRVLIEAARANGSPFAGIGRGMKVSKEAMVGLEVALRRFLTMDHEAERTLHGRQTDLIEASLRRRRDVRIACEREWADWPAPIIRVHPMAGAAWRSEAVRDAMMAGDPSVHINVERGGLLINTHCLREGDEMTLAASLTAALDGAR